MGPPATKPPPVLASGRVLEYAILDESVGYSAKSRVFVQGLELGRVPRLVIAEGLESADVLLLYCDDEWSVLAAAGKRSASHAKARAERTYPGVSRLWVEAGVSKEQAIAYAEEESRDFKCSFCGRRPDQVRNLLAHGAARICNLCVAEFTRRLATEREGE
jgi:hypothetical protein